MLHPKHDRLDYGQLLNPPPEGYILTKAVGTTYSLDLDIIMIMPVAMLHAESLDRPKEELRIDIIDGLVNSASKISIYYQEGKLKVPRRYHFLMAFWEKSLHQVRMPSPVGSFHPKIWVIRFDHEDEHQPSIYRLIITSRNLTSSNDHDVVLETESTVSNTIQRRNAPLVAFLKDLNSRHKTMEGSFMRDLEKVVFNAPHNFEELTFHPIGISPKYPHPLFQTPWKELLIMSPFLDQSTVDSLVDATKQHPVILSTQLELSCLRDPGIQPYVWQFSNYIESTSSNDDIVENDPDPMPQSLHAKLYVGVNDSGTYWYLGSANCTTPARDRNIEFLIGMRPTIHGRGLDHLLEILTSKETSFPIFGKFTPCDITALEAMKNIDLQVRHILYKLFSVTIIASVTGHETSGRYDYRIELDLRKQDLPEGFSVAIRPISNPDVAWVSVHYGSVQLIDSFKDYAENLLTPYLAVSIKYQQGVIKTAIWVMPISLPSTRLNKIFSSIINSRERFMQYLQFLLNGNNGEIIVDEGTGDKTNYSGNARAGSSFGGRPIFEDLLVAVSRDNKKLAHIQKIITRLRSEDTSAEHKDRIISEEFLQFWQIFETLIKEKDHA